jgi:hypothetical protein
MSPDHWILAGLSFVTMLYMAWSMGRISADTRAIAQILREIRDR